MWQRSRWRTAEDKSFVSRIQCRWGAGRKSQASMNHRGGLLELHLVSVWLLQLCEELTWDGAGTCFYCISPVPTFSVTVSLSARAPKGPFYRTEALASADASKDGSLVMPCPYVTSSSQDRECSLTGSNNSISNFCVSQLAVSWRKDKVFDKIRWARKHRSSKDRNLNLQPTGFRK